MQPLFKDPSGEVKAVCEDASEAEKAKLEQQNKFLKDMQRIKDEKKFVGFTPESEQALVAELILMRTLHADGLWHRVNDVWVTGLLPKGALVFIKSKNLYVFVLKAYDCAALCWPAEQPSPNLWRKASNCQSLSWHSIFDLDDVEVLPTKFVSPVHLFAKDSRVNLTTRCMYAFFLILTPTTPFPSANQCKGALSDLSH